MKYNDNYNYLLEKGKPYIILHGHSGMWGEEGEKIFCISSETGLLCNQEHRRRVMGTKKIR